MCGKQTIKKVSALLLILVFSQKMGMGLYLHNWLHTAKSHTAASTPSGDEWRYACSCIDDFASPLAETAIQPLPAPPVAVITIPSIPVFSFPVVFRYFRSLRAPPATTV